MKRGKHNRRCPHGGKGSFTSYNRAEKARGRLGGGYVYHHPACGRYHITSLESSSEYDRRRAAHIDHDDERQETDERPT